MTRGQRAAGIAFASLIAVAGLILLVFVPSGEGPDRGLFGALDAEGKMLGLLAFLSSLVMIGVFAFSRRGNRS